MKHICRYIGVDVYGSGACSDPGLACPRSQDNACLRMLNNTYKVKTDSSFFKTFLRPWTMARVQNSQFGYININKFRCPVLPLPGKLSVWRLCHREAMEGARLQCYSCGAERGEYEQHCPAQLLY